ncbi:uncharacterized protein LOC135823379 [Sycon ciliatum]|uniref:uncharacterized protein LOC135823379 n=1 Tax=Sycon ciliatum TaxID=27933 RepID=UPI0031F631A8
MSEALSEDKHAVAALRHELFTGARQQCTQRVVWELIQRSVMPVIDKSMCSLYSELLRARCLDSSIMTSLAPMVSQSSLDADSATDGIWCNILVKLRTIFLMLQNVFDTLAVNVPCMAPYLELAASKWPLVYLEIYCQAIDGYTLNINVTGSSAAPGSSAMADTLPTYSLHAYDILNNLVQVLKTLDDVVQKEIIVSDHPRWFDEKFSNLLGRELKTRALHDMTGHCDNQLVEFARQIVLLSAVRCMHTEAAATTTTTAPAPSPGDCLQCLPRDVAALMDLRQQVVSAHSWLIKTITHLAENAAALHKLDMRTVGSVQVLSAIWQDSDWLLRGAASVCFNAINAVHCVERAAIVWTTALLSTLARNDVAELSMLNSVRGNLSTPSFKLQATDTIRKRRAHKLAALENVQHSIPALLQDMAEMLCSWHKAIAWEISRAGTILLERGDRLAMEQSTLVPTWSMWQRHLIPEYTPEHTTEDDDDDEGDAYDEYDDRKDEMPIEVAV